MKCVLIVAVVLCVMVAHVRSQTGGQALKRQQVNKARQMAMRGGGMSSMLPMLAMAKGKMNPAILPLLLSRGSRGGMNNMLPLYMMAEGGIGEGMLPMMLMMQSSQGAAGGAAGASSNNMMMPLLFGMGVFN